MNLLRLIEKNNFKLKKMKTYILQKDLPNMKAGTKFIQHPQMANRYYPESEYEFGELIRTDSALSGLCAIDVENNPEWFKEEKKGWATKAQDLWQSSPGTMEKGFVEFLNNNFYGWNKENLDPLCLLFREKEQPDYLKSKVRPDAIVYSVPDHAIKNYYEYSVCNEKGEQLAFKRGGKWSVFRMYEVLDCLMESITKMQREKHCIESDMKTCFEQSRLTHPIVGFKYDTFEDFIKAHG